MRKRIYLSRTDKKLAGVCGGIAEYFDIDVTLVRLLWVLFSISGGAGVVVYIVAAIIMTEAPRYYTPNAEPRGVQEEDIIDIDEEEEEENSDNGSFRDEKRDEGKGRSKDNLLIGGLMVILGTFLFSRNFFGLYWINFRFLSPMILIAIGLVVILNGRK